MFPWTTWELTETLSEGGCHQGCSQAIAHSDFAICSNKLRYLLFFQNYRRITVIWVECALSTYKNQCLALSNLGKSLHICFEISGHPCPMHLRVSFTLWLNLPDVMWRQNLWRKAKSKFRERANIPKILNVQSFKAVLWFFRFPEQRPSFQTKFQKFHTR